MADLLTEYDKARLLVAQTKPAVRIDLSRFTSREVTVSTGITSDCTVQKKSEMDYQQANLVARNDMT